MEKIGQTPRFLFERDARSARLSLKVGEGILPYALPHAAAIVAMIVFGVASLRGAVSPTQEIVGLIIGGVVVSVVGLFHTIDGRARARSAHPWLRRSVTFRSRGRDREVEVDGRRAPAEGARVIVTTHTVTIRGRGLATSVRFFDVHLAFEGLAVQLLRTKAERESMELASEASALFDLPAPAIVVYMPLSARGSVGAPLAVLLAAFIMMMTLARVTSGSEAQIFLTVAGFVLGHIGVQELVLGAQRGRADRSAAEMLRIAAQLPKETSGVAR